jgi:phosphatidylinositol alpha-1,6-mannosyltransferase
MSSAATSPAKHKSTSLHSAVFLTPGLGGVAAGGIQESASIAWEGLCREDRPIAALSYGPVADHQRQKPHQRIVAANSRSGLLLKSAMQRWDADVLLIWHLGLVKLLPFLRGRWRKIVVFLHGIEAWRPLQGRVQRVLGRANVFLSNSEFTWQRFVEFNPAFANRPHQVVPLGWGEPVDNVPSPEEPPAALMIGRLRRAEDYKGHREMIAAWRRVVARIPDARLWIAGDGDLRRELEQAASRTGVSDRIQFCGRVSEETKQDLLRRCTCLAMPSRGEGFGLVYLEAMRLGRPCLVSTCDAGREVVAPPTAGLAVDPKDEAALVEATVSLLSFWDHRPEWSVAARERYETNFTASHFQGRLVSAVNSAC